LRDKPDNAIAHYNLGVALEYQDDLQAAIKHYSEAVRTRPDVAEANQIPKLGLLRAEEAQVRLLNIIPRRCRPGPQNGGLQNSWICLDAHNKDKG